VIDLHHLRDIIGAIGAGCKAWMGVSRLVQVDLRDMAGRRCLRADARPGQSASITARRAKTRPAPDASGRSLASSWL
jgi:hypothetical protein